jgi:hypothetical protein
MASFIDALAKRIFYYMKYRDDEIDKLNKELNEMKRLNNRGYHMCHWYDHEYQTCCPSCGYIQCDNCMQMENCIYTKLGDNGLDIVIDKEDEDDWEDRYSHYIFCSDICFKNYYNRDPIVGESYRCTTETP